MIIPFRHLNKLFCSDRTFHNDKNASTQLNLAQWLACPTFYHISQCKSLFLPQRNKQNSSN